MPYISLGIQKTVFSCCFILLKVVDAIVCDPPYGVRAGGRKSVPKDVAVTDRETHVPSTDCYALGECLRDLLDMAARLLVIGMLFSYYDLN